MYITFYKHENDNSLLLAAVGHYIWDQCSDENVLQHFPQTSCLLFSLAKILLPPGHTPSLFPSIFEFPRIS